MGGTDFKWGAGHHWPPAGDGPVPAHTLYDLAGVEVFFNLGGPALLKCYRPRATVIRHWVTLVFTV